jgi:hypothetical protein
LPRNIDALSQGIRRTVAKHAAAMLDRISRVPRVQFANKHGGDEAKFAPFVDLAASAVR